VGLRRGYPLGGRVLTAAKTRPCTLGSGALREQQAARRPRPDSLATGRRRPVRFAYAASEVSPAAHAPSLLWLVEGFDDRVPGDAECAPRV